MRIRKTNPLQELLDNPKRRVYISGPITGTDDYLERFAKVEGELIEQGYSVINPARTNATLPIDTEYEEYMSVAFTLLDLCDTIYMMKGWQDSRGANREYGYALGKGMKFM